MAGGHAWPERAWLGEGCVAGGVCGRGGMHGRGCAWQGACVAGETATAADSMHLTGMHSYYTMYCTHYTVTETGTGNHCFLLYPSRSLSLSRSRSRAVCMSHYTLFFFATCFRLAPSCQVIHNSTKLYKGRELTVNAVLNTGFSTHDGSGWQANFG